MIASRILWLLLCLISTIVVWVSGTPLGQSALIGAVAAAPAIVGLSTLSLRTDAGGELEMAAWVLCLMLGVAFSGGWLSPLAIGFVLPAMIAFSEGKRRLAMEAAAFSVIAYVIAISLKGLVFIWDMREESAAVWGMLALSALIYFCALVQRAPWGAMMRGVSPEDVRSGGVGEQGAVAGEGDADKDLGRTQAVLKEARRAVAAAEQARAQAEQALENRTRFFAQTSHELRTPLNAILGFSEVMKSGVFGPLSDRYQEYVALIHEGGKSLQVVVDDVLDLSKIEAGRYEILPEQISLSDGASEAVRFMTDQARRRHVRLGFIQGDDVEAFADVRAVRQIALNLISNAIKFTPEGGRIAVAARRVSGGAVLSVRDSGPGLDEATFKAISQPFMQGTEGKRMGAAKGTGLGLSVANAFARLHGGRLGIASREGKGTTVSVFFPDEVQPEN